MPRPHPLRTVRLAALSLLAAAAGAQTGGPDSTLTPDALRPTEPPGFVLLGGAPSAAERPGSVRALTVALLTRATASDPLGAFGVQVAPFWLGGIPRLSYPDYERAATGLSAVRRTLTVSAAVDRLDLGRAEPDPAVSLGVRASLATGTIDTDYRGYAARRAAATDALDALLADFATLLDAARRADPAWVRADSLQRAAQDRRDFARAQGFLAERLVREEALDAEVRARADAGRADALAALDAFDALPTRRVGFVWDVAGGWAAAFPGRDFDAVETYRWGAWTTAGYAAGGVTLLAVGRYLRETALTETGDGQALDVGGRLIWDGLDGALSLSGEGVYRAGLDTDDRYRVAAEVAYAVSPDRTLAFTFGRDFDGEPTGNVLALLRLVAGFGGETATLRPETAP